MSHFVTDGSEAEGSGRDGSAGSETEKPRGIVLFGIGRNRLESPSEGSIPGHPKTCSRLTRISAAQAAFLTPFVKDFVMATEAGLVYRTIRNEV